jgi:hypothetical protein
MTQTTRLASFEPVLIATVHPVVYICNTPPSIFLLSHISYITTYIL